MKLTMKQKYQNVSKPLKKSSTELKEDRLNETIEMLRVENERLRREVAALLNKIPHAELLKSHEKLLIINDMVHSMVTESKLETVLWAICEGVKKIFGYNRVGVLLVNEEKKLIEGKVSLGLPKEYIQNLKLELKPAEGISMRAVVVRSAMEGEVIPVLDRSSDPDYRKRSRRSDKIYSKQFVAIPLKTKEKTYGIFTVAISDESSLAFSEEDINGLKFFGEQTAILVENCYRRHVKDIFSKYVSPSVVNKLLSDPKSVKIGGENREITILFSDLRNFTNMAERTEPAALLSQLNEHFSSMVEIILKYDGTVDKFIGDSIMALWNTPTVQTNHASIATRCAIEMVATQKKLNEKWKKEGKHPLNVGIGINTGDAVVGNVGSEKIMGYTAIGDNVNLAWRLEGVNKQYGTNIVVSEYTYDKLKSCEKKYFYERGKITVKGREAPVGVYSLKNKLSGKSIKCIPI